MEQNLTVVADTFGAVCERHRDELPTEASVLRVWQYLPGVVADLNRRFDDLNRQVEAGVEQFERAAGVQR